MKILIDKTFQKDWKKIKDKDLNQKLIEIIEKAQLANQLSELPQLKKLSGSNHFYRIRLGDFRLGLELDGEVLIFVRILHRKEIYRYFP
ncbi:type II toxin-antitoxin system RelE family toxin [Algoriphagus mannitolivorans]|uniref:type II toxin-antitoxin system RelE family toxin n=1 Tax=Algoriphagus mannitolivorans TaxID=226504 RepID=UPI000414EFBA|nr:type II toxin-antitoxin system RelE/ParE family toxin [Algoriphagus mannitolivorans]